MTSLNIKNNSKLYWVLTALVLISITVIIYAVGVFKTQRTFLPPFVYEHANKPFPGSDILRKGNLNGIPIAVPSNYLYFTFQYLDKSIWEPPKPGDKHYSERTYGDGVGSFSLYVNWPDMQPRNRDNNASYLRKDDSPDHAWLMVSVQSDYITSHRPPASVDNYYARLLRQKIERLSARPVDGGPFGKTEKVRVKYEYKGVDESTGLKLTVPVGPYTELFHTWNHTFYWHGDKHTVVTDLIDCQTGKMSNPESYHKCRHQFEFPEMRTYVSLRYPRSWLPQWRELKMKSKELLQGFVVDEEISSTKTVKLIKESRK